MNVNFEGYEWNGVGHFNYGGQYMMQNHKIFPLFKEFFTHNKFQTIVEIGTANGGFTIFLADSTKEDQTKIYSYDIHEIGEHLKGEQYKTCGVNFRIANAHARDTEKEIANLIKYGGKTAVFCDGGDKIKEVNIFARHLKSGDFILAHDYAPDVPTFSQIVQGKIWNWLEIQYAPIKEAIEGNGIEQYYPEVFQQGAWFCGKKK